MTCILPIFYYYTLLLLSYIFPVMTAQAWDDEFIIDPSLLEEPDVSEWEEDEADEFWFDSEDLTMDGEHITDDDEDFDQYRDDIFEAYEKDPNSIVDDDDDDM